MNDEELREKYPLLVVVDDGAIDNSTERYVDLIHRFNKDKAFDYVIGLKDKEDKILDERFDNEDEAHKTRVEG